MNKKHHIEKSFTEHSYNYVNRSKTTKPSNMNTQNYSFSQSQNIPQLTSNSLNFNEQARSSQDQTKKLPIFSTKQK